MTRSLVLGFALGVASVLGMVFVAAPGRYSDVTAAPVPPVLTARYRVYDTLTPINARSRCSTTRSMSSR